MNKIEFVSYSGKYPNLCDGRLVVKIDGKEVSFYGYDKNDELAVYPKFWCSGGGVEEWNEQVVGSCDWEMSAPNEKDYPPEIWEILPDVLKVMNENVDGGCCGGCVWKGE